LPTWAKGVIAVAVTGTLVFVGYKVYTKGFKSQEEKDAEKRAADEKKQLEKELKKDTIKVNPSYPLSQYTGFADAIYDGVRYCVGDDYDAVENTLKKMKNDLDVVQLIKNYGSRQRYCFGIPAGDAQTLFPTVVAELGADSSRIKKINNDWANKNIKYRI
jgi:hypothetical protein